jgi:hypothetical protein
MRMSLENSLDLLLVLLYAPGPGGRHGEEVKGFTRLQKLFFLLWQEAGFDKYISELKEFEAYNYGPFSNSLFDDIEFAKSIELIAEKLVPPDLQLENSEELEFFNEDLLISNDVDPDDDAPSGTVNFNTRRDFHLTEKGFDIAMEIWGELSDEDRSGLQRVKTLYNSMPFMELIRYVYSKYPKYAKKSLLVL